MRRKVVSCCYAPQNQSYYASFADRLVESLKRFCGDDWFIWRDEWPPDSPAHQTLHYAFKWYAVEHARQQGYSRVIWLDAGTELIAPIAPLWDLVEREGVGLMCGDDPLGKWINDACLVHYGYTREQAMGLSLCGGAFVGVDFDNPKGREFFAAWEHMVKRTNFLMCSLTRGKVDGVLRSVPFAAGEPVSLDPRVEGHRSDEACFTLLADKMGIRPMSYIEWREVARTY